MENLWLPLSWVHGFDEDDRGEGGGQFLSLGRLLFDTNIYRCHYTLGSNDELFFEIHIQLGLSLLAECLNQYAIKEMCSHQCERCFFDV